MTLTDIIAIAVIAAVVGIAVVYIVKQKKKGRKCIGCPYADACAKKAKENSCSCNGADNNNDET
jgi:hypothetical protein